LRQPPFKTFGASHKRNFALPSLTIGARTGVGLSRGDEVGAGLIDFGPKCGEEGTDLARHSLTGNGGFDGPAARMAEDKDHLSSEDGGTELEASDIVVGNIFHYSEFN
jgi:hypothetical protein